MPSTFAQVFGEAEQRQLRVTVGEKAGYATGLPVPILTTFRASGGRNAIQNIIGVLVPNVAPLTPPAFRDLLTALGTGANALTGTQLDALFATLSTLTPANISLVLTTLRAALNPTQTHQLITRLRLSLTAAHVLALVTAASLVPEHGNFRIGPAFLVNIAPRTHPTDARTCARLILDAIAACQNSINNVVYALRCMEAFEYPPAAVCELLGMMPTIPTAAERHLNVFRFLRDGTTARGTWPDITKVVTRFLDSGRSPHGAAANRWRRFRQTRRGSSLTPPPRW